MSTKTNMNMQNWLELRYEYLCSQFKKNEFSMDEVAKLFDKKYQQNKDEVSAILSELRKAGRIKTALNPDDNRKRIYQMILPEEIILDQLSTNGKELTRSELEGLLKKAADLIRTRVDYKFILVLLFYKRVSDKWQDEYAREYKKAIKDGLSEEDASKEAADSSYHDFDLPQDYLWENLRKDVTTLPEKFSRSLKALADRNSDLKDILDNVDFIQFTSSRENAEILRQLVELFSKKSLHNVAPDILGDAYEWILRYFAPTKAKEGEVYTAREVIRLLVTLLDPKPKNKVYDPAAGSGGMLISTYDYIKDNQGKKEADKLFLYGQEVNHKTLALERMNLYIHDIKNASIVQGDTILHPRFKTSSGVEKFDIVIANPPWNHKGYDEDTLKKGEFWKDRFSFGFTTKQSADWAWIQHMLASAEDKKGKVGVIIDNGCLFRGSSEKKVRQKVLENNLIEAVLLLPEKLFYNTGAPGAIIILNKNKAADRKDKVLFINASAEFGQHPDVRKLNILTDENIEKIHKTYNEYSEIEGFSRVVNIEEIEENDFNLNVTLYVFPEEEIEEIDIDNEWEELHGIEEEISEIEKKIARYLKEIR